MLKQFRQSCVSWNHNLPLCPKNPTTSSILYIIQAHFPAFFCMCRT